MVVTRSAARGTPLTTLDQGLSIIGAADKARLAYREWCHLCEGIGTADIDAIRRCIAAMESPPFFHVLLFSSDAGSPQTLHSVSALDNQIYRHFTYDILAPVESDARDGMDDDEPNRALSTINAELTGSLSGHWLLLLQAGDILPVHALYWFAHTIAENPRSLAIYSDDDELDTQGERCQPRFKPDWSLTHFLSIDFIGNAVVFPASALARAEGIDAAATRHGPYGLFLRMLAAIPEYRESVHHVPAVLLHRRPEALVTEDQADWQQTEVNRHLHQIGRSATVISPLPGIRRIRYQLPHPPPKISIIIPTRDAPALLRRCIDSLLARTHYPNLEVLVVDNQSRDPEALHYLATLPHRHDHGYRIRVMRYDREFNFSDMNNRAAREASGEFLCLLNNDTEVINGDWLREMVGHLLQPGVGAVGAKLLYPDGHVQHAGDVVGRGGCANHLHSRIGRDDPGYCRRAIVAQELSAVTAACLLTPKALFLRENGFDARFLQITFNDVDYCLRLRRAGLKIVWTPYAELYHHESISRGKPKGLRKRLRAVLEAKVMRRRWREAMRNDPFYNPNFAHRRPDFALASQRLVPRPWQLE